MSTLLAAIFGVLVLSGSTQANPNEVVNLLGYSLSGVQKVFTTTLTTNCTMVKNYLGLLYSQMSQSGNTPDLSKLKLTLYTQNSRVDFKLDQGGKQILDHPQFNPLQPTIIYCHGFMAEFTGESVTTLTTVLLKKGGMNVLALDSSSIILENYLRASTCVHFIGQLLGKALADMYNEGAGIDLNKIRIIGHSLGAHISGIAGKRFKKITGVTFSRITGMDPAGPCFFQEIPELMLNRDDADFVDVIHTDAGVFGYIQLLGHADFYPNNGEAQPNCLMIGCSHSRSWEYFAESITYEQNIPATFCGSWNEFRAGSCNNNPKVNMGYALPTSTRGVFFLKTGGKSPFGLKEAGSTSSQPGFFSNIMTKLNNMFNTVKGWIGWK